MGDLINAEVVAESLLSRAPDMHAMLVALALAIASGAVTAAPLEVFVSILPQKYFVERVGGDAVRVGVMVRPGESPASYYLTPKQMVAIAGARAYFRIGVAFEDAWLPRMQAANPLMRIIDTRIGIDLQPMDSRAQANARSVASGQAQHRAGAPDPHIWTSPPLVKQQAATVHDALTALMPDQESQFKQGYDQFAADLDLLDAEIRQMLADKRDRRFMVSHPAWGYFADCYGLKQIAIEVEGKEPGPQTLARLIETARRERVTVVFLQSQFAQTSAQAVARSIGGEIVPIDPLAEDFLTNTRAVAHALTRPRPLCADSMSFLEALFEHGFLQLALATGLVSALGCGVVGSLVVVRRITFLAGGIAHAVLGGMGVAHFLGYDPITGATITAVLAALLIGLIGLKAGQREDMLIGAVWAIGMAIGIIAIAHTPGYSSDLMSYLLGNLLMVTREQAWAMALLDALMLGALAALYRPLVATIFDEEFARVRGLPTTALYLGLLAGVALAVVVLVQAVGLVLVMALLTLPAATALLWASSIGRLMLGATAVAAAVIVTGLGVAFDTDSPAGATIVLCAAMAFLTALALRWAVRIRSRC